MSTPRDRDESGRPRNARPRDPAGRPLPMGAAGVPRIPDDLSLTPEETLAEAQRLLDDGKPFHAHEVLEAAWKSTAGDDRAMWRALAQLAVGLTHAQRGNAVGAAALLRRAADGLRGCVAAHGVDPGWLARQADELAERADGGNLSDVGAAGIRLRRAEGS